MGRFHNFGADGSIPDIGHDIFQPMVFNGIIELFHFSSGRTIHQPAMFFDESIDIGVVVPEDFPENVIIHGVEDPEICFRFQECSESVGRDFFEE